MKPIPMVVQGKDEIAAYACGKCRMVVSSPLRFGGGPGSEEQAARVAEEHCEPPKCSECGETKPNQSYCRPCADKRATEREATRFAKARKVTVEEYDEGPVFAPDGDGESGFFMCLSDALDHYAPNEVPAYFYGSARHQFVITRQNVDSMLENAADEHHEAIFDHLNDVDSLYAAIDAWNDKQKDAYSYDVDDAVAIIVPGQPADAEGNNAISPVYCVVAWDADSAPEQLPAVIGVPSRDPHELDAEAKAAKAALASLEGARALLWSMRERFTVGQLRAGEPRAPSLEELDASNPEIADLFGGNDGGRRVTYEYECSACKHQFEAEQSIKAEPLKTCPACKQDRLKRLISSGAFVLQGKGWFKTGGY